MGRVVTRWSNDSPIRSSVSGRCWLSCSHVITGNHCAFLRAPCRSRWWFKLHRAIQISGWLLQIIGFVVSFFVNQIAKRSAMPHAALGIVVFILGTAEAKDAVAPTIFPVIVLVVHCSSQCTWMWQVLSNH